jgi:type I restriction enzyme, S subunit
MSLATYPTYKKTELDWLGQIPTHWRVFKLKHIAENKKFAIVDGPFGTQLKAEDYRSNGVPLVRISNLSYTGDFLYEELVFIEEEKANDLVRSRIQKGDIVIGKTGATIGKTAIFPLDEGIIASSCLKITPNKDKILSSFLSNNMVTKGFIESLIIAGGGSTRDTINIEPFSNLCIAVPTIEEQKSITSFLEYEIRKIDSLVLQKKRLVELFKEKRKASIYHAVTKGLDPKVKMKPSGLGLLSEVPQHWEVKPIQWIASINDEVLPESTDGDYEIEYVDIGSVNLSSGIERSEIHKFKDAPSRARRIVKNGDVIVSTVRTYLKAIAFVKEPPENMIVSTGFAVIRSKSGLESNFAKFGLQSTNFIDEVISRSTGISYPAINASDLAKIKIPIPPIEEQIAICDYLDKQTLEIDSLISESKKIIVLLQERRSALISAAVTGQIDVRNYQPKEVG